jgi:hypothetical protein
VAAGERLSCKAREDLLLSIIEFILLDSRR